MKVLIIGASGLVGGNCQAYFRQFEHYEVLGTHSTFVTPDTVYFNLCDLKDPLNAIPVDFEPAVVVHCGALTFVDYCENHIEESHLKTVTSTANALALAAQYRATFVYLSTDYVFDGQHGPYTEADPVNPICVYGAHKLEAEQLVLKSGLAHLILRITNVYGDEIRGKNFVSRLLNQIRADEQIHLILPYDQYATPINALDVARVLKQLLEACKQGVYHLGSTDYMNRYQLAQRVLRKFAYANATLTAITTQAVAQLAPRPLNGGLVANKFLSEFPEFSFTNLDDYLTTSTHV